MLRNILLLFITILLINLRIQNICSNFAANFNLATMSKEKAVGIYEYPCSIYPRMIWVAFDCPKEVLDDLFEDPIRHWKEEDAVWAYTVHNRRMKPDVKGGMLMVFKKEFLTPDVVAHEAVHAAMGICNYCGMEVSCRDEYQEYFAYLVGWIVECVYKALEQDGRRDAKQ